MKNLRFIATLLAYLQLSFCVNASVIDIEKKEGSLTLSNGLIALVLDSKNAEILQLVDIKADQDFQIGSTPLFDLILRISSQKKEQKISATMFRKKTLIPREGVNGSEIAIVFEDCPDVDLKVICRFRVRDNDQWMRANIEVLNHTDYAVEEVYFPQLHFKKQLGTSGDDDELLMPHGGGALYKNPGSLPLNISYQYPGLISFQMLAFYDSNSGLTISTQDPEGNVKFFEAKSVGDYIDLTIRHLNESIPGGDYLKTYSTVIGTTRAPWFNAADQYKTWAVQQPWCRTRLSDRTDTPDWWKKAPIFMLTYASAEGFHAPETKLAPEEFLDNILQVKKLAGVQDILYSPIGWERSGVWLGPYYFPPQPSEEWWKSFTSLGKPQGIHSCLMTSGFKWVFKHNKPDGAEPFDYTLDFEKKAYMAVTNADGTPFIEGNVDLPGWTGGRKSRICRGTPEGRGWMKDIFMGIAELGADATQIDQERGGMDKQPCYNPDHDHAPGYGKWMWEDYRRFHMLKDNAVREINPEFFSFQEDENELTIQYQPTSWTRDYAILDFLHPNAWGIPAYSYLYHEYVTTIGAAHFGGQGTGADPDPRVHAYTIGRCLANGFIQGINFAFVMPDSNGKPQGLASEAYFRFCKPLSDHSQYLILGKRLRPFDMECDNIALPFNRQKNDGSGILPGTLDLPAVLQGAFESPDGKTGIILVNPTEMTQKAIIRFPKETYAETTRITKWVNGKATWTGSLKDLQAINIERLGSLFLELE